MKKYKPVDLAPFKDALEIVRTGKDAKGNRFTVFGQLNQAGWIGENSGPLIEEIEFLRAMLDKFGLMNNGSANERHDGPDPEAGGTGLHD